MNIFEQIQSMSVGELVKYILIILGILSVIVEKSKKLPFNPWSALFRWIGNKINEPINTKLDNFDKQQKERFNDLETKQNKRLDELETQNTEIQNHIIKIKKEYIESIKDIKEDYNKRMDTLERNADEKEAKRLRSSIICFSDSCRTGERHTKQHFENVFRDYDDYSRYCEKHDFENHFIDGEMEYIKSIYTEYSKNNKFL